MKTKLITAAVLLSFAFVGQSCKKDYECHCDKKAGGADHIDINAKKADAESACTKLAEGTTVYSKCELE